VDPYREGNRAEVGRDWSCRAPDGLLPRSAVVIVPRAVRDGSVCRDFTPAEFIPLAGLCLSRVSGGSGQERG